MMEVKITKKSFYHLSLFTLYGFGLIGWLIIEFWFEEPFIAIFYGPLNGLEQTGLGLIYGAVAGLIAMLLVRQKFLKDTRIAFQNLIGKLDLTNGDILFFSICAAVGEEIFFRGAIQPLIGIWPTAIIFVALHGYLSPKNWRLSIYGIFMVIVTAGFGYLYEHAGMLAAISAHFIIDVILFKQLQQRRQKPE